MRNRSTCTVQCTSENMNDRSRFSCELKFNSRHRHTLAVARNQQVVDSGPRGCEVAGSRSRRGAKSVAPERRRRRRAQRSLGPDRRQPLSRAGCARVISCERQQRQLDLVAIVTCWGRQPMGARQGGGNASRWQHLRPPTTANVFRFPPPAPRLLSSLPLRVVQSCQSSRLSHSLFMSCMRTVEPVGYCLAQPNTLCEGMWSLACKDTFRV